MNGLLWIAQILLAGVFLFAGLSKIFAYERKIKWLSAPWSSGCVGVPHGLAAAIAVFEIAASLCLLLPVDLWPPDILLRLAAGGLGILMVAAGIYHLRRKESAVPAITLFLLALFVVYGRSSQ
jgi:uncharacterized membrane protein YphA (DoxX/SURF4 family)